MNRRIFYLTRLIAEAQETKDCCNLAREHVLIREDLERPIKDMLQLFYDTLPNSQEANSAQELEEYCHLCGQYLSIFMSLIDLQNLINVIKGKLFFKEESHALRSELNKIAAWYEQAKLELIFDLLIATELESRYVKLINSEYINVVTYQNN